MLLNSPGGRLPLRGSYHPPQCWGPGALLPESALLSPQVVGVAPELLRVCSLILAENKVPPGDGGGCGQGWGEVGSSRAQGAWGSSGGLGQPSPDSSPFTLHPDTKASLLLLLTFLAKQHADSFRSALGSLPGDKAQELQAILGLT